MNIGKVLLSLLPLPTFQKNRTTYGRGPETKKLARQGKKSARQGGFKPFIYDTIHPCLAKTKKSSSALIILAQPIFSVCKWG